MGKSDGKDESKRNPCNLANMKCLSIEHIRPPHSVIYKDILQPCGKRPVKIPTSTPTTITTKNLEKNVSEYSM